MSDPINERLKEVLDREQEDESHAEVRCRGCREKHMAELFESPPDGWRVRYWCPNEERRRSHSAL